MEDSGAGTSLVQEMRGLVSGIVPVTPKSDKVSRMAVASAKFEAGQVLLPEWAPWLPDLEAELFAFPAARHDDQCVSISQALEDNNTSFMQWMTPADWQELLLRSRIQGQMDRLRRQFRSPTKLWPTLPPSVDRIRNSHMEVVFGTTHRSCRGQSGSSPRPIKKILATRRRTTTRLRSLHGLQSNR